jgi:hypothetical protein
MADTDTALVPRFMHAARLSSIGRLHRITSFDWSDIRQKPVIRLAALATTPLTGFGVAERPRRRAPNA